MAILKNIDQEKVLPPKNEIDWQKGHAVSKTLVRNNGVNIMFPPIES